MSHGFDKTQKQSTDLPPSDTHDQFTNVGVEPGHSTRPAIANDRIIPPEIPGYTMIGVLGQGGMGVVFKAYDQRLLRNVAIKMVAAGPIASDELVERFQREAQAFAQIQHPNIAQIYEVGEVQGRPYLVMEFVSGGTLSEQLKSKPQTPAQAATLIETLARAVEASHQAGILHRDLKPSNILLTREGTAKITDFGLAKRLQDDGSSNATRTGDVVGTPAYMSPEQAGGVGRTVGPQTDVYSLGVILFEMLTGRPPFQTPDPLSTVMMVLSDDPVPPRRLQPSLPRDLETICLKCLEKLPSKRYATAAELADDLGRLQRREPIRARRVGVVERALKLARRHKAVTGLITVAALSLIIIIGMWIQYDLRLRSELDRTNRLFNSAHRLASWLLFEHINSVSKMRGSTAAKQELVQQMLVYLDALANEQRQGERVTAEIMEADLALAYERIAALQGDPNQHNTGESREALNSYRKALVIRQRLAAENPDDLMTQLARVAVGIKIADLNVSLGSKQQVLSEYQDAERRLKALRTRFPHHIEVLTAQGDLQFRIGDLYFQQNKLKDALDRFQRALGIADEASRQLPNDPSQKRRMAVFHSRIANVLQAQGNLTEAREHFGVMLGYAKAATAAAPLDAEAERDLSVALVGYGDALFNEAKVEDAHAAYVEAVQMRRTHSEADPQSASVARDLAVALERLGTAEQTLQRPVEASDAFREALTILTQLRREEPENVSLLHDVCLLHDRFAAALLNIEGKAQEANEQFQSGLDYGRQLLLMPEASPADLEVMAQLNAGWAGVQIMLLSENDSDEQFERRFVDAAEGYNRSLEIFERMMKLAPLTSRQQQLRDKVEKARDKIQENLQRLRALPNS